MAVQAVHKDYVDFDGEVLENLGQFEPIELQFGRVLQPLAGTRVRAEFRIHSPWFW